MIEVIAVNVGGWKRVKRIEIETQGIRDEEFELARAAARREAVFGSRLWLDRRVVKPTVSVERIRRARRDLTLPSPKRRGFEKGGE